MGVGGCGGRALQYNCRKRLGGIPDPGGADLYVEFRGPLAELISDSNTCLHAFLLIHRYVGPFTFVGTTK